MGRTHREQYPAIVRDVADPEQRGRILVECRELIADGQVFPYWVEPMFPLAGTNCGWFFLPVVGDIVQIELVQSSGTDAIYGISGTWGEPPRWLCCEYRDGPDLPSEFIAQGKYGSRMGIKMPSGQLFMFDEGVTEIVLKYGKLRLGSETASEPLVLGLVFQTFASTLLTAIATHTHPHGDPVVPAPTNAATFTGLKASPIVDGLILSDAVFTQKAGL